MAYFIAWLSVPVQSIASKDSFLKQWRIQPGAGGPCPPPLAAWQFFASILILLLSRLHTMGRANTKVAVCRRLVFDAFCCLCAVHCMQAAAASFVSPKAVFLVYTTDSWTAKNSAHNALKVDIFRCKVKKIFWGGGTAPSPDPSSNGEGEHSTLAPRLQILDPPLLWNDLLCVEWDVKPNTLTLI